ncbi:MAG: hypothetical protein KDB61_03785, partial [Planctomycetes bacterium]|nr:hypothetical protein [Planctomycetota bacterium]
MAALAGWLVPACMSYPVAIQPADMGGRGASISDGVIDLLTYNVAGLPGWVAKVDGSETHSKIGPALESFDLVLMQEDFWYHDLLKAPQRWQAAPRSGGFLRLGDGLARFSRFPLDEV